MNNLNRRKFLKDAAKAGAAGGLWPALIQKVMAVEASYKTGTIKDVQHIVIPRPGNGCGLINGRASENLKEEEVYWGAIDTPLFLNP